MWTLVGVLLTMAAVGQGSPVLTESSSANEAPVPQPLFSVPLSYKTSRDYPSLRSVLVTSGGKILIAGWGEVKMVSLETPNIVEDVYEDSYINTMLELQDGTIALAKDGYTIPVLRIVGTELQLVRNIYADEDYKALALGPEDGTLLASTVDEYYEIADETEYARIDVIDMDGKRLRTLRQYEYLMEAPSRLKRYGDDLYVSDYASSELFRVNVHTGKVSTALGCLDLSDLRLREPGSFDIDDDGTLYVATGGSECEQANKTWCILQITQSGAWQVMDDFVPQYTFPGRPVLALTSSQIIIGWVDWHKRRDVTSELTSYSLPPQPTSSGAEPECEPVTEPVTTPTTPTTSASSSPQP